MELRLLIRLFVASLAVQGLALSANPSVDWLTVTKASLEPETDIEVVEVVNASPWGVTAYAIEVQATYPNGDVEQSYSVTDLAWDTNGDGVGQIPPGGHYTPQKAQFGIPGAVGIRAKTVAVIFSDRRFAGDEDIVQDIFRGREGLRLARNWTLRELARARDAYVDLKDLRRRLRLVAQSMQKGLIGNTRVAKSNGGMSTAISNCASNVEALAERIPDTRLLDVLDRYITDLDSDLAKTRLHVTHDVDAREIGIAVRIAGSKKELSSQH